VTEGGQDAKQGDDLTDAVALDPVDGGHRDQRFAGQFRLREALALPSGADALRQHRACVGDGE